MQGRIINITRFCTDDGPGIRTTVFLKGCPLRCFWCHNPESQRPEPERYRSGETVGRWVDAREVVQEVARDLPFYETSGGGVTVSGGEPLLQPEFTARILELCRQKGIHTAMETCGYAGAEALETVLPHCDLVLFDIKETDETRHLAYTGVSREKILDALRRIDGAQIPFVLRLPVVPGFQDRQEHFRTVRAMAEAFAGCRGVEIMPYHKLGEYKYRQLGREYAYGHVKEPTREQIRAWERMLSG